MSASPGKCLGSLLHLKLQCLCVGNGMRPKWLKFMTLEVDVTMLVPSCALNIYVLITVIENQVSMVSGAIRVIQLMRV